MDRHGTGVHKHSSAVIGCKQKRMLSRRKWKVNFSFRCLISTLVLALLVGGCGGTDESNPLPSPTPIPTPTSTPYTPPDPSVDPRLPDLSVAVPLRLADPTNLSGLQDLAHNVFAPLVGDPKVAVRFTGGRDALVTGKILVAFEDKEGFWGAELNSFDKTGVRTSQYIDIIFADDEFVLRAVSGISGDNLNGTVFYRVRRVDASGQILDNECRPITVWCEPVYPFPYPFNVTPTSNSLYPGCNTTVDVVTPCRAYMSTGNANVKQLGTFNARYSTWVLP